MEQSVLYCQYITILKSVKGNAAMLTLLFYFLSIHSFLLYAIFVANGSGLRIEVLKVPSKFFTATALLTFFLPNGLLMEYTFSVDKARCNADIPGI
jgi:hypothetical protein